MALRHLLPQVGQVFLRRFGRAASKQNVPVVVNGPDGNIKVHENFVQITSSRSIEGIVTDVYTRPAYQGQVHLGTQHL